MFFYLLDKVDHHPLLSVLRVCWPLGWSLSPCLLHCPCLQSPACTLSLWSESHARPATSPSTVSPDESIVMLCVFTADPNIKLTLLYPSGNQVTTRRCSAWPATACWRACLPWRPAAVWWRSSPPFPASSSAHLYPGQRPPALVQRSDISHLLCGNKSSFFCWT